MAAVDRDLNGLQNGQRQPDGLPASLQQNVMDPDVYGNDPESFSGYDRSIGVADADGVEQEDALAR